MSSFDLTPPSAEQRAALEAGLSADERRVLLQHGTEAPFCGVFLDNKREGTYCCRLCGLPLFRSSAKFDSGTGWPSFFAPYDEAHIARIRDTSHGMIRVEEVCARCSALGGVRSKLDMAFLMQAHGADFQGGGERAPSQPVGA